MAISEKQLAANRRNAQRSTGPKTREGKEQSRANATTHGLTASPATIYRPIRHENPAEFAAMRAELLADCQPQGAREQMAVEMIAAAYKRIQRCDAMEAAMFTGAMDAAQMGEGKPIQPTDYDDLGCSIMAGKPEYKLSFQYLERYRRSAWSDYNRALEQLRRLQKDRLEKPVRELRAAKATAEYLKYVTAPVEPASQRPSQEPAPEQPARAAVTEMASFCPDTPASADAFLPSSPEPAFTSPEVPKAA